jgi:HSP20 family protein
MVLDAVGPANVSVDAADAPSDRDLDGALEVMMANDKVEEQTNNGGDGGRGNEANPKTEKMEEKRLSRRDAFPLTSGTFLPSPFSLMSAFLDDMDRLARGIGFDGPSSSRAQVPARSRGSTSATWTLPVEVSERDGQLVILAEVPGMAKDNISVDIDADRVVISGERAEQHDASRGSLYVSERRYGHFARAIVLPPGARPDEATASFADGILEIEIPLATQPGMRRLEVRDGSESKRQRPEAAEAKSPPAAA